MNIVTLYGRVSRDPKIFENKESDSLVASFTIACQHNRDEADFVPCKAFGKTAEIIEKYVHKGDRLTVNGSLGSGQYEDKDGNTVYTLDVMCWNVELVETKKEAEGKEKPEPEKKSSGRSNSRRR